MKNCPNCGNPVADSAAFCNACGKPMASAPADVFCPNCGEKISGGGTFCPNCGNTIQAKPAAPVKKTAKKAAGNQKRLLGLVGAAVAVVLLVVLIVAVVPTLFTTPGASFVSMQTDLIADKLSAVESVIEGANKGFSSDLTITASVDNSEIEEYLKDTSIVLKVDANQDSLLANAEATFMGSPVLNGTVTVDKQQLGFYLPAADDTYYVYDLAALFELADMDIDMEALESADLPTDDIKTLAEKYIKLLTEAITKDSLTTEKGKSVKLKELGGKVEKCTVYTFEPKAEDVEEALLKIAEELEKDKKLRKVFEELIANEAVATYLEENVFYDDPADAFEEALDNIIEGLEDDAADIGESIEDSGFTWTVAVKSKDICLIEISVKEYDESFVYECKKDGKDVEEVFYYSCYDEVDFLVSNEYKVDGKVYDGKLTYNDGYDEIKISYEMEPEKVSPLGMPYGEYKVAMDGTTYLTIEVAEAKTGVDHTVTLKELSYDTDGLFNKLEVTINATEKSSAKKPSASKEDISDYDEEELYELVVTFGEALAEELSGEFEDLFYGSYDEPYPDYSYDEPYPDYAPDAPAVSAPSDGDEH